MTGYCPHWDEAKGYGKIMGADRQEYFAHRDDLVDVVVLHPGDRVVFRSTQAPKGPRAVEIRLVETPSGQRSRKVLEL